ncbi:MAG: hypothetical protein ACI8RZ_006511, partial [Myxococcota bacterium]
PMVLVLLGIGGIGAIICGGAFTKSVAQQMVAKAAAAEAMETLRHHKTDHAANTDPALLEKARSQATRAREIATTSETLGAEALAEVWSQGWQLSSFDADAVNATFHEINTLTRQAADAGSGEGALARAIVASTACARLPATDDRRSALCEEAGVRFYEAASRLDSDDRAWLRFEVWWTAAEHHNLLAAGWWAVGRTENAESEWQQTLTICAQGSADISAAPVNDIFLARQCLIAAGGTRHYGEYVDWAHWLRGHDEAAEGALSLWNAARIFRAAQPDCRDLSRSASLKNRWIPKARTDTARRCYYAGLRALSCDEQADEVREYLDRSDLLVAGIRQATRAPGRCYLD